jgi:hypothetical protein
MKRRIMKLAEALSERADAVRRLEQLRARIVGSARYQEGETPPEDATQLLAETNEVLDSLETLIARINRTNTATSLGEATLTEALARRDVMRLRHAVLTAAADAAAGRDQRGVAVRQLRSELKMLAALPVAQLRSQADALARELRDLDVQIQRTNWEADLVS